MAGFQQLDLLLPCHSLEDFPTHLVGDLAEGVLANWVARWHPQIISATNTAPSWTTVGEFSARSKTIFLLPVASRDEVLYEYPERGVDALHEQCEECGATLLADRTDRDELAAEILRLMNTDDSTNLDDDLIRDFYALGYWHLQIEILTRQMRYACHLDESQFLAQTVNAARMACSGDSHLAHVQLQKCFTMLAEERNHYYPVDSYLLELSLVAPTSSAKSIEKDLRSPRTMNFWTTGATAEKLHQKHPDITKQITAAAQSDDAQVVGCEYSESPITLQSAESHLADLRKGVNAYEIAFGTRPTLYFRRRYGLNPALPFQLVLTGWQNAVHATLDAGKFPKLPQSRTSWEGFNIVSINAFGQIPLDASRPETFLKLSLWMGESMERDYVAAICLAHWSGQASHWIEEVQRGAKFGVGVGLFSRFEDFFASTEYSSQVHAPSVDGYQAPFLSQSIQSKESNPISQHIRAWSVAELERRSNTLLTWAAVLGATNGEFAEGQESLGVANDAGGQLRIKNVSNVTSLAESGRSPTIQRLSEPEDLPSEEYAADLLARKLENPVDEQPSGRLLLNVGNKPNRDWVTGEKVPPLGFLWLKDGGTQTETETQIFDPEESSFKNEFFTVQIDEASGAIRAVYDKVTRGNRLSQRLAHAASGSTAMRCEEFHIVKNDSVSATVKTTGKLFDGKVAGPAAEKHQLVAQFEQEVTVRQGSRVIELVVRLQPEIEFSNRAWRDYIAVRWAWASSDATIWRSILGCEFATNGERFESPQLVRVAESRRNTAIICGGLPYHHRCNDRMLDTLLHVQGEQQSTFRLGIAIDPTNPQQSAMSWRALVAGSNHDQLIESRSMPPATARGSLFHIDSKHVIATGWEPVWSRDVSSGKHDGSKDNDLCVGFRVRLRETSGKSGQVRMTAPRAIETAVKCDLLGVALQTAEVDDGAVVLTMSSNEWTEVDCRW